MPEADRLRGDGDDVLALIRAYGRITKDSIAGHTGDPLASMKWQERLIGDVFARTANGRRRHRTAMIGVGRKNGKTGLMAPIALYGLMLDGSGAEVYSCAADRDQARLIFGAAKRTVELDPELSTVLKTYRDAIEYPATGSIYRVLSSEAYTKEGLSPTMVLADELHAWPNRDLYDVMALAMGARVDPLMLIVTTAGVRTDTTDADSIAYTLWQYGCRVASGEVDDPTFYLAWWSAPGGCALDDRAAWSDANPGLGVVLDPDELGGQAKKAMAGGMSEAEFRIKRLNQWVASTDQPALPGRSWEACAAPRTVDRGTPVVLGFDGSWTGDSTAIVGATIEAVPHLFVVESWERPSDNPHWRVDAATVDAAVRRAMVTYDVAEFAADPHEWRASLQAWEADGLPVTEWVTGSLPRIIPAWKDFYAAVMEGRITHDADPRLARHVGNAVLRIDRHGARPTKEHKDSTRKIDLLIAAVIAYDRAAARSRMTSPVPLVAWA